MGIIGTGMAAVTRAVAVFGLAAAILLAMPGAEARAEDRTLHLYFTHTKETIKVTYKRNGRYVDSALKKLNHFLRDWRQDKAVRMDPELFDILWEVHRLTNASGPIHIVSAYRSPKTNAALRSRSRNVAKTSQHMRGKAIDFYIPGVDMRKVREVGLKMQRGGVGWYPSSASKFVHLDTGSVRHWPRMSRQQLARLFPDGKTVHVPTDGKPMPRYAEAARELARRGKAPSAVSQQFARASGVSVSSGGSGSSGSGRVLASSESDNPADAVRPQDNRLFSFLFGDREDEAEETAAAEGRSAPEPASTPVAATATATLDLPAAPLPPATPEENQPVNRGNPDEPAPEEGELPAISLAEAPLPPHNPFALARAEAARDAAESTESTELAETQAPVDLSRTGQPEATNRDQDAFDRDALVAYARDDSPADRIEALLREEAGLSMMEGQGNASLAALSREHSREGYEWLNRTTGNGPELVGQDVNWRFISPSRHRRLDRASAFAEAPLSFRLMRLDSPLTRAPRWVLMEGFSFDNEMLEVGRFTGTAVQALRLKGPLQRRTTTAELN